MLVELRVESMGVIDVVDLLVGPGLTALTGETGAGKTMLVEAIALLLGGRADPGVVRAGCAEARVEGRFIHDSEEYVVCRVIPVDGRSRTYVNGRLATVASLAELTGAWVDLHGQHAQHGLLEPAAQRDALDRWAGTDLDELRACHARLVQIDAELAALGGDERSRAHELDLLRFQAGELDDAALDDPAEDSALAAEYDVLSSAVELQSAGNVAGEVLGRDGGASDLLSEARAALGEAAVFAPIAERLDGLVADLDDLRAELRAVSESIEDDPARLEEVRLRRQVLRDLRRKYGDTLDEVIRFGEGVRARVAEIEGYAERAAALERARAAAVGHERRAAAAVGATRRDAAAGLGQAVQRRLRTLGMPHAEVCVQVGATDPGDDVVLMFTANPGSPAQPLAKVASGGELARAMLALRLELSAAPDTLVFDEVDAGIGGRAAQHVAAALAELAERHQVLVVTHLAQVAALATDHIVVDKRVEGGSTTAEVSTVRGPRRVEEVARLLSGDEHSDAARRHAAELLNYTD